MISIAISPETACFCTMVCKLQAHLGLKHDMAEGSAWDWGLSAPERGWPSLRLPKSLMMSQALGTSTFTWLVQNKVHGESWQTSFSQRRFSLNHCSQITDATSKTCCKLSTKELIVPDLLILLQRLWSAQFREASKGNQISSTTETTFWDNIHFLRTSRIKERCKKTWKHVLPHRVADQIQWYFFSGSKSKRPSRINFDFDGLQAIFGDLKRPFRFVISLQSESLPF